MFLKPQKTRANHTVHRVLPRLPSTCQLCSVHQHAPPRTQQCLLAYTLRPGSKQASGTHLPAPSTESPLHSPCLLASLHQRLCGLLLCLQRTLLAVHHAGKLLLVLRSYASAFIVVLELHRCHALAE